MKTVITGTFYGMPEVIRVRKFFTVGKDYDLEICQDMTHTHLTPHAWVITDQGDRIEANLRHFKWDSIPQEVSALIKAIKVIYINRANCPAGIRMAKFMNGMEDK